MSFEEGFATGMKLAEMWTAKDDEEKLKQAWIKNNPEKAKAMGLLKDGDTTVKSQGEIKSSGSSGSGNSFLSGFRGIETSPVSFGTGGYASGIGGQEINRPSATTPTAANPVSSTDTPALKGYNEGDVTTAPLKPEEAIVEGFPTTPVPEDKTRIEKTSPYGTYDEKGMESPADQPYGYGAIPVDEKAPVDGNTNTPTTIPQIVAQKAQEAKTPEEAAGIINGYKNGTQANQETVPQKSVYQTMMDEMSQAQGKLNKHEQELQNITNTADAFRSLGKFKEAAAYEKQAVEQQKLIYESTDAFYKVYNKGLDLQGSFIKSYQGELARGVPIPQAKANLQMALNKAGVHDIDKYFTLPQDQFDQAVNQIMNSSQTVKDQMAQDLKTKQFTFRENQFKQNVERNNKLDIQRQQNTVFNQNLALGKFTLQEIGQDLATTKSNLANAEAERTKLENKRIEVQKNNLFYDDMGIAITEPEDKARYIAVLNQQIGLYDKEISILKDHGTSIEKGVPKADLAKITKTLKDSVGIVDQPTPTTNNNVAPAPDIIKDTIEALNKNPSKALLDHVRAKFRENYPGLEFEKYIKVNPAKYK